MTTETTDLSTAITGLLAAIDSLADEMLGGCPSKDPLTDERLTFDGQSISTPGFSTESMNCRAVAALAEILLYAGHDHAARMVIAAHIPADIAGDEHFVEGANDPGFDRLELIAAADAHLNAPRTGTGTGI